MMMLVVVMAAMGMTLPTSSTFNLDDITLFSKSGNNFGLRMDPFLLQNITWYSCPLYSASPVPVYQNMSNSEELDKFYYTRLMNKMREHIRSGGRRDFSTFVEPDITILRAIQENRPFEVFGIPQAECALVALPLDYTNYTEDSARINIFVKRLRQSTDKTAKKSLWLLQGGPGGSCTAFESIMHLLQQQLPDFDLYTLDHRGVGYSTRLGCVATQAETTGSEAGVTITDNELYSCARAFQNEYGQNTNKFSPTGAAWDLAALVATTNNLYHYETHVYGVSYGTMWLSRFLQISENNGFSNIINSAIMDGVVSTSSNTDNPDEWRRLQFTQWDTNMNQVGLYLLNEYCNNTICAKKLGTAPVQVLETVFQHLYVNYTCPKLTNGTDGISSAQLRTVLGTLLLTLPTRELIPAIIYRLKRCDPDVDVPTLKYFFSIMLASENVTQMCVPTFSQLLQDNIGFSELWAVNLSSATYDQLYAMFNKTYMATGGYLMAKTLEISQYPRYTPDAYFNKAPKPQVPVLLLNGNLDAQTPLQSARWQVENMNSPTNTRLIEIPYALHATVFRSPQNNTNVPCGMELMSSFLASGQLDRIDLSCLSRLIPLNFTGNPVANTLFFGVSDIYEDAYEAPEVEKKVNLYLFIGVEAGTVVVSIIIICCLIYYIVQLKDKSLEYEEIEE